MRYYETKLMKIADIKIDGQNPNKMDESMQKRLSKSLKEFGNTQDVIVDANTFILADGEHRIQAYIKEGWTEIPVKLVPFKNDAARRAFRQASNKIRGEHDHDLDMEEIRRILEAGEQDLVQFCTGMDMSEVEKHLRRNDLDKTEETIDIEQSYKEPKYKIERGEVWKIGNHFLMCGDSTKEEDVSKLMDGFKADMVLTDPPFAISGNSTGVGGDITDQGLIRPFFEQLAKNLKHFTKKMKHVYVCCDWRTYPLIFVSIGEALNPKNCIVWNKMNGGMSTNYMNQYELIGFFHNYKVNASFVQSTDMPVLLVNDTNVWNIIRDTGKGVRTGERSHFAMKPIELCERAINNSSKEGETVLDLFGGSGSTMVACEKTDRRCRMMEIDPHYCSVILERMEQFSGKQAEKCN